MKNTPFVREKSALAPNPEVSADMYLARLSGANSHAHIYAAHPTIFYSHAFFHQICFATVLFLPYQFSFRSDLLGPGILDSGH